MTGGALVVQLRSRIIGALAGVCLLVALSAPVASAPPKATDTISGTWQVTRVCNSGCQGTTVSREVVSPYRNGVFTASGPTAFVLYRIGKRKIVVHSALSSSLLTIHIPGQVMRGPGILQDGSTFTTIWRCIAPPGLVPTSTAASSRHILVLPSGTVKAQRIC